MTTECWFRNPHNYVRELAELGIGEIAFDRGLLVGRKIEIDKWATGFLPGINYRILLVGEQGTAEITPDTSFAKPKAVYPTWTYGDPFAQLEELCAENVANDPAACNDPDAAPDERPVSGQEHRVIVTRTPVASTSIGRQFFKSLKELQDEYPDCIIHVHGLYGFRTAFGMGYRAVDIEPRTSAAQGKIFLSSGREVHKSNLNEHQQWIHLLGFSLPELEQPRNRCLFNIKSAIWASQHFNDNVRFTTRPSHPSSPTGPGASLAPTTAPYSGQVQPGDKVNCDTCSLSTTCKFYREGAICSLPGTEQVPLAKQFKTRDSDIIIEGLGSVMAAQARRLDRGIELELESEDGLDPEVTRIVNSLMKNGIALAKLINPALASPKLGIYVGAGMPGAPGTAGPPVNPKVAIGKAMAALEQQGIPRSQITPDMIKNVLGQPNWEMANRVIESTAITRQEEAVAEPSDG